MSLANIVFGLVEIADGLARVLSLGLHKTLWPVLYRDWLLARRLRKQLEKL